MATKSKIPPNIIQRGNSYVVVIRNGSVRDADGKLKPRQYWKSFRTLDAAKHHLDEIKLQKRRHELVAPTRVRFDDFAVKWLEHAAVNIGGRTLETYEGTVRNHLVPEFGGQFLTDITREQIDMFVADWSRGGARYLERVRLAKEREKAAAAQAGRDPRPIRLGNSASTIANGLTALGAMLNQAVAWSYLTSSPAKGVSRPRVSQAAEPMHPLDASEVGRLLAAADAASRTLILTAVTTGVRLGELLALRWGDVDWERRQLWVRRSVSRSGEFHAPKTKKSVRAISITPTLKAALREHHMASGRKGLEDLIFPNRNGGPLDGPALVRRHFKPALRRAKLPLIRFHDLRHTFASLLIHQGEHVKLISEQLGHATSSITMDRYGHLLPQSYDEAGDRLEAALFGDSQRGGSRSSVARGES
jgi:integrase